MNIAYSPEARGDIKRILDDIATDNQSASAAVGAAIKTTIARIRYFPRMGAVTGEHGVYMKIARPYQYLIFYEIIDDTAVILTVRHPARRKWPVMP